MDKETQKILTEQQLLSEVTSHQGWAVARRIFSDKILELQNVFDIETATPTTMFRDMQARKKAVEILWAILQEVEGAKDVVETNPPKNSFVVKLD